MINVVVGSGIAGMTLALMLAKRGEEVLILEAQQQAAPLMNGFTRKGLFFDTGFHYAGGLQDNGILRNWLEILGVWKHLDANAFYLVAEEFIFKNSNYTFSSQETELNKVLSEQFSSKEEENVKLIIEFQRFRALMQDFISSSPFLNPLQKKSAEFNPLHEKSLSETLEDFDFPDFLKKMLIARCQLLGIAPEKCAFKNYSVLSEPYFQSSASLANGGKAIREAFLKELKAYGIEIQCNSIVEKLIVENKKIKSVQVRHKEKLEEINCKQCFYTGHPKNLVNIAPKEAFRPAFLHRIEDLEETPLCFMLFAKSSSNYLQNKVLYLLDEEVKNFFNPLENEDPVIYISSGKPHNGQYPIIAIATVQQDKNKDESDYKEWKEETAIRLLNYIQKRVPQLSDMSIVDIATPHSMRDWIYGSTGSLYGISHECDELPLLPITKLEGFYLAGQNILLPGLLGAIVSSLLCLSLIYGYDEILQGFRNE